MIRRQVVRVVCLNAQGEALLINSSDPYDRSAPSWWELPGGGIDPGESPEQTVQRELHEECGITSAQVHGVLWTNRAIFDFAGWHFDQDETIYLASTDQHDTQFGELEAFERLAFSSMKWWNVNALAASAERTVPVRLKEFIGSVSLGTRFDTVIDISPSYPEILRPSTH